MRILRLTLAAAELDALEAFYSGALGLPMQNRTEQAFDVRIGSSVLTFERVHAGLREPGEIGAYHFAVNVPENQIEDAARWLQNRVALQRSADGRERFRFEGWNADAVYFGDPAGNVVELIARDTLRNSSAAPFGPESLLEISEIGLAVPSVRGARRAMERHLGLAAYGTPSEEFAAMGDERGLLLFVKSGRPWMPEDRAVATPAFTRVLVEGTRTTRLMLDGLPYEFLSESR